MYIGVQGRLVRPQPVDDGVVRGLCAALCGRYDCLRYVAVGPDVPALVLSTSPATRRVLLVSALRSAERWTALYLLRLCEEVCARLRADLPLCDVPLRRALMGRQVWFVPLPYPDGGEVIYHSTAGRDELQAFGRKSGKNPAETDPLTALCRQMPFCHAVVLGGGEDTVGWYGGDATPPQSRLMAQVLSAVSGFDTARPLAEESFPAWFIHTFHRPALSIRFTDHSDFDAYYAALREMLLLSTLF